jgi:hypothetical protein
MKCPACGSESGVIDSRLIDEGRCVTRRRGCECGARWTTHERKATPVKIATLSPWMQKRWGANPLNAGDRRPENPPHAAPSTTTYSGLNDPTITPHSVGKSENPPNAVVRHDLSDSGSDPKSSPALSDPALSQDLGDDRARPAKSAPFVYPAAFEAFWSGITSPRSKGLKSDALRAWSKKGKPAAEILIPKWGEYLSQVGEYPKDVCRWIAARGWEEEYEAAPVRRSNGASGNVAVLGNFLRKESK